MPLTSFLAAAMTLGVDKEGKGSVVEDDLLHLLRDQVVLLRGEGVPQTILQGVEVRVL